MKICAGENFTLTCVTDTGTLEWYRVGGYFKIFNVYSNNPAPLGDHITVYPTNVSGSVITSVANITRAPLALNGTVIQCRDHYLYGAQSLTKPLLVSGIINLLFYNFNFDIAGKYEMWFFHCTDAYCYNMHTLLGKLYIQYAHVLLTLYPDPFLVSMITAAIFWVVLLPLCIAIVVYISYDCCVYKRGIVLIISKSKLLPVLI